MRTLRLVLSVLILCPTTTLAQTGAPPSADRLHDFVYSSILSPGPYVLDLGAAAIDELSKFPREWQDDDNRFGRRFLARVGSGFASDVIGHATGAVLGHRVLYEPCRCRGGWRRTKHAIGRGFVTRHDDGRVVFHVSIFVAKFSAAGISNAWYPRSYTGSDVVREGLVGVGANAGVNILREFGPDMLRMIGAR